MDRAGDGFAKKQRDFWASDLQRAAGAVARGCATGEALVGGMASFPHLGGKKMRGSAPLQVSSVPVVLMPDVSSQQTRTQRQHNFTTCRVARSVRTEKESFCHHALQHKQNNRTR
jgi:hypothetical protein